MIDKMDIIQKAERIKLDFVYSEYDAGSQLLKSKLSDMISSLGRENFEYNEYNFLSDEGKRKAELYKVKLIPTLIVDDTVLINPDDRKVREILETKFNPQVKIVNPQVAVEEKSLGILNSLTVNLKDRA